MKNLRTLKRIGKSFEVVSLNRFDFGKLPQKSFIHHIMGGVHELSNADSHVGSLDLTTTGNSIRGKFSKLSQCYNATRI